MIQSFQDVLKSDSRAVGTLLTTGSTAVSELIALCGFDWVFIDTEHGSVDGAQLQPILQSIAGRCHTLVRISELAAGHFKKALDSGCDGIIVPLVNSAEDARSAVAYSKYPPLGERSVGIGRAHRYGLGFKEYVENANSRVALIVQIEHIQAVNNLDAILDVAGIDGIFLGPYDLSGSLGVLGQVSESRVKDALTVARNKCIARGIPVGSFVMQAEAAVEEFKNGCKFVAVGLDMGFLAASAQAAVSTIRKQYPAAKQEK